MQKNEGVAPRAFWLERWNDFWDRPRARWAAYILIGVLLIGTWVLAVWKVSVHSSEFRGFYHISRVIVVSHDDVYTECHPKRAYPPFFGVALFPFCWSGKLVGAGMYAAVNCLAMLLCPLLCVRAFWPPGGTPRFGVFFLLWLLIFGMMEIVACRCESDLIILLSICVGLFLLIRRNLPFWAGVVFSLAAAVKILPGFIGFYFLWKRNWRAALGMMIGFIFLVGILMSCVLGLHQNIRRHQRWWEEVVQPYHEKGPRAFIGRPYREVNASLTAMVYRFLTYVKPGRRGSRHVNIVDWPEPTVRRIAEAASLILLIGLMVLWWGKSVGESPILRGAEFSTVLIAILELSKVSLESHHVALLVPFAVELVYLAAGPADAKGRRTVIWGMAITLLLMCASVTPICKALSFMFLAAMTQLAILVYLICRLRRQPVENMTSLVAP